MVSFDSAPSFEEGNLLVMMDWSCLFRDEYEWSESNGQIHMTLNEFASFAENECNLDYGVLMSKLTNCGEWNKAVTF